MSTNYIPFETSKNPISAKAQVIAELEKMVVDRLFGQPPWLADRETISAYRRKLIQMGLVKQVCAEPLTWRDTPLGKEVDVQLFKVFIGIWDPWEVPWILQDRGLIDESECHTIAERLDECWDKVELEDAQSVLLPFVKRAYLDYRNAAKFSTKAQVIAELENMVVDRMMGVSVKDAEMRFTDEDDTTVEQAMQNLARYGLIYDTGESALDPRTGQHQILWASSGRCNCGHESDECLSRNCPYKHDPLPEVRLRNSRRLQ